MIDKGFSILASIVIVAGITAMVLPGRQTPAVIREGGSAFAGAIKAATGR
jgi:hypothetical protein